METVGVECVFTADGRVQVRRVEINGRWRPLEQGRQWVDHFGRHVLVMLPGEQVREIVLRPETMTWVLMPLGGRVHAV